MSLEFVFFNAETSEKVEREDSQIQFILQTNRNHTRLNKVSLGRKKKWMTAGEVSSDQM